MTKPRCQTSRPRRPSRKMTSRGEMVVTLFDRVASAGMCHGYEKPRSTALNCNNASAVSTSLIQHASLSPHSLSLSLTHTHTLVAQRWILWKLVRRETRRAESTRREADERGEQQRRNSGTGSYLMLLRRLCQRYYTADSQGSEGASRQQGGRSVAAANTSQKRFF